MRAFPARLTPFSLPPDYARIRRVRSFEELATAPFADGVNALCWERALSGARSFSFGLGNLWRIAVDWPGSAVPPHIHRAPETGTDDGPPQLLIS